MPVPDDGVLELDHGDPDDDANHDSEESEMPLDASSAALLETQLMQTGNIAQNNFVTAQKVVDYDYLENKRMVTLDEAVGIREVQSAQNPAGPGPRTV